VSYAAFKNHCSLFPASTKVLEACGDELKPYFSGKGTIRFTADKPLPSALVKKIMKTRIEEIAAPGSWTGSREPPHRDPAARRSPSSRATSISASTSSSVVRKLTKHGRR